MSMVEVTCASSENEQENLVSNGFITDSENLNSCSSQMKARTDGLDFVVDEYGDGDGSHGGPHEKLIEMVAELKFENEYLKAQFEGLKLQLVESSEALDCKGKDGIAQEESDIVKELSMKINSLMKELQEQRQMQIAAENALNHVRLSYSESDTKAQELSAELVRVQQKMYQEIKDRDEKNVELESKISRLHKRAKQKIQELQKEKDDTESRFKDLSEAVEKVSSEKLLLQQELDRARQGAADALRLMDVDRQQLRTANSKLRESNDELCRSLGEKEKALEEFRQSLIDKEQMIEETRRLLESANEKRDASAADLIAKHQKNLESLEGQLADVISEKGKAAETISSLQALIVEKESQLAELEAASTGEAVRLKAAIDELKGELNQCRKGHESEKENWNASYQVLKNKLEIAENQSVRCEIELEKLKSSVEAELSVRTQLLDSKESELASAREKINRLESEFSSYKARAHVLLQKKDAELAGANEKLIKAREEALKEMEKELEFSEAEKDKALQDLHAANAKSAELFAEKDAAIQNMIQKIKQLETNLESINAQYSLEKEEWQSTLENVEKSWRIKHEALEAQNKEHQGIDFQRELEELKLQYTNLQEEHSSFRDIADKMIEEKDKEISRLSSDNKNLRQSMESQSLVQNNGDQNSAFLKQDPQASTFEAAEQQILLLARQQAQREEQLAQSQRHILALQEEIEELERENHLHSQQQAMLKAELREMERSKKREGVDMTYLKNVVLKLLETGEVEALLPVVGMLLQFSPEEIRRCQQAYNSSSNATPSSGSDGSTSGRSSLFPRFPFT